MKKILLIALAMLPLMAIAQKPIGKYDILFGQIAIDGKINQKLGAIKLNSANIRFTDKIISITMSNFPILTYIIEKDMMVDDKYIYDAKELQSNNAVKIIFAKEKLSNGMESASVVVSRSQSYADIFTVVKSD